MLEKANEWFDVSEVFCSLRQWQMSFEVCCVLWRACWNQVPLTRSSCKQTGSVEGVHDRGLDLDDLWGLFQSKPFYWFYDSVIPMFPQHSAPSVPPWVRKTTQLLRPSRTLGQEEASQNGLCLSEWGDEPDAALPASGSCLLLRGWARRPGSGPVQRCEWCPVGRLGCWRCSPGCAPGERGGECHLCRVVKEPMGRPGTHTHDQKARCHADDGLTFGLDDLGSLFQH